MNVSVLHLVFEPAGHKRRYDREVRIKHDRGPLEPRRDLREQFKPFACQRGFVAGEAGDVPTRAVEPRDDAVGDGVARVRKDDRDRPGLPLDGVTISGVRRVSLLSVSR